MGKHVLTIYEERRIYYLRVILSLLIFSCFTFSLTNYIFHRPLTVVIYNLIFGIVFTFGISFLRKRTQFTTWYTAILFQVFMFGHAYFLLPGKQIEHGLPIAIIMAPLFLEGAALWILLLANAVLFHIALLHAHYDSFFIGIYIFYFVLFLIVRAVTKENKKYEEELQRQKKIIEQDAEEIKKADQLKTTFFSNVTHELKTPLTLIMAPLESMLKSGELSGKNIYFLKLIRNNGFKLIRRVNELLEFSKLGLERAKINLSSLHISSFADEVLTIFKTQAIHKGINFNGKFYLKDNDVVKIDVGKLEIIVNNLLSNAIKFTPQNGNVDLLIRLEQNQLEIKVEDSGVGISPKDMDLIFERFGQSDQQNYYEGAGIGLALSKELVELMGGEISVESVPDKGSTFTVQIPCSSASQEEATNYISESKGEEWTLNEPIPIDDDDKKHSILIVEDNKDLREYLSVILTPRYDVKTAENGKEALDFLQNSKENNVILPSLILSDLMMPEMNGQALIQAIKSEESLSNIPLLVLTAVMKKPVKLDLLRIGVDDYLVKPFMEEELILRIDNLVKNHKARTNNENDQKTYPEGSKWLKQVESIVYLHIGESDYKLSDLANDLHISPKRLQQKIKEQTGMTPKKYQQSILLHKARELIYEGLYSTVSELSLAMGYEDQSYFTKLYKSFYGISPSDELKRVR